MPKPNRTPSPAGWHFLSTFNLCKYKFYLAEVIGLESRKLPRALLFGTAIHEGLAAGFKALQARLASTPQAFAEACIDQALSSLKQLEDRYQDYSEYRKDLDRAEPLLDAYARKWFKQDSAKRVLEVEKEHSIPLPSGFFYTVRIDAILQREDGSIEILEHKTSSFSSLATLYSVMSGGQSYAYLHAAKHLFPKAKRIQLVPDVLFMSKAGSERTITCERGRPIEHSQASLDDFAEELESILLDINSRVEAVQTGLAKPHQAFPRSREPGICLSYNHPCEFFDICLLANPASSAPEFGFSFRSQPGQDKAKKKKGGKHGQ
jgi:hypothetical protein